MTENHSHIPAASSFGSTAYNYGTPVTTSSAAAGNTAARRALRFAALSLALCAVFAPFALGYGIKGYKEADLYQGEGRWQAITAIVLSSVQLAAIAILLLLVLTNSGSAAG